MYYCPFHWKFRASDSRRFVDKRADKCASGNDSRLIVEIIIGIVDFVQSFQLLEMTRSLAVLS